MAGDRDDAAAARFQRRRDFIQQHAARRIDFGAAFGKADHAQRQQRLDIAFAMEGSGFHRPCRGGPVGPQLRPMHSAHQRDGRHGTGYPPPGPVIELIAARQGGVPGRPTLTCAEVRGDPRSTIGRDDGPRLTVQPLYQNRADRPVRKQRGNDHEQRAQDDPDGERKRKRHCQSLLAPRGVG